MPCLGCCICRHARCYMWMLPSWKPSPVHVFVHFVIEPHLHGCFQWLSDSLSPTWKWQNWNCKIRTLKGIIPIFIPIVHANVIPIVIPIVISIVIPPVDQGEYFSRSRIWDAYGVMGVLRWLLRLHEAFNISFLI